MFSFLLLRDLALASAQKRHRPRPGATCSWRSVWAGAGTEEAKFETSAGPVLRGGSGNTGHQKFLPNIVAGRPLTFNEPDRARPELAGRILHVILPEGLHKKSGSSALSGARVAREASEGRPLKLGCAPSRRARLLGKCIWGLKFLDRPPLPKTYSREGPIHLKSCFYRICCLFLILVNI